MSLEDEIAALLAQISDQGNVQESQRVDDSAASAVPDLQKPDKEIAVGEKDSVQEQINAFRSKWDGVVEGDVAFNLLTSPYENDYSGMIQANKSTRVDELIEDIYQILSAQKKVTRKRTMSLCDLFVDVTKARRFDMSGDENLPKNELVIINDIRSYQPETSRQEFRADGRFMFERLSHIVDDRYVLVVGSVEELSDFLQKDRKLRFVFEEHTLILHDDDPQVMLDATFNSFKACVSPDLANLIDEDFRANFDSYVRRNERDLPFCRAELGDYLAKHCNALGKLALPKGRSFKSAQEELDKLIGLSSVKRTMSDIAKYAAIYERDKSNGLNPPKQKFHMVFSGPAGTGKTTVGKIAAQILYEAGVIPTAQLEMVSADKLVDPAVGRTAIKTQDVIDKARGGVLFVDEAYSLVGPDNSNVHGMDAVTVLIQAMENLDDIVIIFAGYRDEIAQLVKSNPGFKSRISFNLDFEDFSPDELMEIFMTFIETSKLTLEESATIAVRELIDFFSSQRGFGNARFMRQVFHRAYINRAVRLIKDDGTQQNDFNVLLGEDIPTITQMMDYERDKNGKSSDEEIAALVGLENIKTKVREFKTTMCYRGLARERGLKNPTQAFHMVFAGNPGTGKTTVARIIAKILFESGVTASPRYRETTAQDFVGEYVGHTGVKTQTILEDALGGVLFIDEAYAIGYNSSFGQDAIAEIVKFMEDYRDQIVIIFAGYSQEMDDFLSVNPGLASRIGFHFEFEDYGTDELQEIFERKVTDLGYTCTEDALEKTRDVFRYFHSVENFGNGRFVDKVVQAVIARHAENLDMSRMHILEGDDVPSNKEMCELVSIPVHKPQGNAEENARRIAVHEMGHAICGLELFGTSGIKLVTIEEEATGALGYVEYEKDAFPALPTRAHLTSRIAMCMGGMAAEELFMGDYSAGNTSDLEQATALAASLVARYGMSPQAGYISYPLTINKGSKVPNISDLPEEVRSAIQKVMADALDLARNVLSENSERHEAFSGKLISEQTISGECMHAMWNESKISNRK